MPSIREDGDPTQIASQENSLIPGIPKAKVTWNAVVCDILVSVIMGICRLTLALGRGRGQLKALGRRLGTRV